MRWGRVLRWGRVGFLRRRLPYLRDLVVMDAQDVAFWLMRPRLWVELQLLRRTMRPRDTVVGV